MVIDFEHRLKTLKNKLFESSDKCSWRIIRAKCQTLNDLNILQESIKLAMLSVCSDSTTCH